MDDNTVKVIIGTLGVIGTVGGVLVKQPKFMHRNGENGSADRRQLDIERHESLLKQLENVSASLDGHRQAIEGLTEGIHEHHEAEMRFWDRLIGEDGILALRRNRHIKDRRVR